MYGMGGGGGEEEEGAGGGNNEELEEQDYEGKLIKNSQKRKILSAASSSGSSVSLLECKKSESTPSRLNNENNAAAAAGGGRGGLVKIASITKNYKIGPRIGTKGAFGEVRKAVGVSAPAIQATANVFLGLANSNAGDTSTAAVEVTSAPFGYQVAVKILKKTSASQPFSLSEINDLRSQVFYKEVTILRSLNHPKIVKFIEAFEDEQRYYLVMELCQGGDLYEYIESRGGHISESETRSIMRQLVSSLEYLHERGIVHCDIKPNNVMFAAQNNHLTLRLIDFGMAQCIELPSQTLSEHLGTTGFMAPEVLYESYCEKADVWPLGVLMFMMLYGFNPFDPYNKLSVDSIERRVLKGFKNVVNHGYGAWFPETTTTLGITEEARDLIAQMLTKDVTLRPSVYDLLEHPFFEQL